MVTKMKSVKGKVGKAQKAESLPKAKKSEPKFPIVFKEWETTGNQTLKVTVDQYKGRTYNSVRKYWLNEDDELQPGKGVTFTYEDIDDIIEGLKLMKKWLEDNPKE